MCVRRVGGGFCSDACACECVCVWSRRQIPHYTIIKRPLSPPLSLSLLVPHEGLHALPDDRVTVLEWVAPPGLAVYQHVGDLNSTRRHQLCTVALKQRVHSCSILHLHPLVCMVFKLCIQLLRRAYHRYQENGKTGSCTCHAHDFCNYTNKKTPQKTPNDDDGYDDDSIATTTTTTTTTTATTRLFMAPHPVTPQSAYTDIRIRSFHYAYIDERARVHTRAHTRARTHTHTLALSLSLSLSHTHTKNEEEIMVA